jgi:hypothetical protein
LTNSAVARSPPAEPSGRLTAEGGSRPYKFSLVDATEMPPGLSLSTEGAITGSPVYSGYSRTVRVRVIDKNGHKALREIPIRTIGESYDLSFTQESPAVPCVGDPAQQCTTVDFVATHSGNTAPLNFIDVSVPVATQAGVGLYKRFQNLSINPGQSFSFSVSVTPFTTFIAIDLYDASGVSVGSNKNYVLIRDPHANYLLANVE